MKKGFSPIIILLILVAVALMGVAYLAGSRNLLFPNPQPQATSYPSPIAFQSPTIIPTPGVDPTANWKTYSNKQYGFQLKYPNTWYSTDCGIPNILLLNPKGVPECATEPFEPIQITAQTIWSTAEEVVSHLDPNFKATIKESNLANNASKYFIEKTGEAPGPTGFTVIYVPLKAGILTIGVNDPSVEGIANQILSTFKFTQ